MILEPKSLTEFVKYAFENWQTPAPLYIVLLGDMSYDYRALLQSSRPNFIPSIPYYTATYGQAASDNLIVSVAGNDVSLIWLLADFQWNNSEEISTSKLADYPDDQQAWKQNVLFLASGLSLQDETQFVLTMQVYFSATPM